MRRCVPVAAILAALLVLPSPARCVSVASQNPAASSLFAQAETSFAALRANARAQRQRQNFTAVLEAYRVVFEKHPASREAERSLMRAGELQTLLFRWTGQEGDLNRAQNYYQRLVQTNPKSPLVDDALLAIAYLYLEQFKDPAQAWLRFRDVTLLAPRGDKAAEAKRQLKRLAVHAAADKPAQAAGSAPAPPPTVIAAPPPTVIAMPPPTVISMAKTNSPLLPKTPVPPAASGAVPALNRVRGIRHWSNPEYSRVVIDLDQKANFYSNLLEDRSGGGKSPRLYIDLFASLVDERSSRPIIVDDGILHGIRAGQYTPDSVRVVLEIDGLSTYRVFPMQNPFRIVVDVTGGAPAGASIVESAGSLGTPSAVSPPGPPGPPPPASPPPRARRRQRFLRPHCLHPPPRHR